MKEILLTQTEKRKLEIELSPDADFNFVEVNPDVVTFDKAKRVLTAKNNLSEDAKIIFTPTKNGYSGESEVLVVKVRRLYDTRIEPSYTLVDLKEGEFLEISINSEDANFTCSADNSNISVEKINPFKIRVKGVTKGTSNITINASASEKAPASLVIPVTVEVGVKNKKFYFGQIPTSTGWDWDAYDANPAGFDFEPFILQTATKDKLQAFDYSIVNTSSSFSPRLNEINSFVYFVFEMGDEDGIVLNSTADFNPLSEYPISSNKYEFTEDLGEGERTYSVLVTPTYRQSMPSLYIKN